LFNKLNKKWLLLIVSLALILPMILSACTKTTTTTTTTTTKTTPTATVSSPTPLTTITQFVGLNGAGATFPGPLYSKIFDQYYKITGVQINYQAVGSGSGITQITNGTVDFGASDGIMSDAQVTAAQNAHGAILHIPMTIAYNIAGIGNQQLKLTGTVLAGIYLGTITRWNDPQITAINSGLNLPDAAIAVVHRSDGSGTTYIFTNYLSKISSDWSSKVGNANSVSWPVGLGGAQSAGVAGLVQQTPNSIGYVELAYAITNNIAYAQLQNSSGNYIVPTMASASKAAEGITLPDDMKLMITNSANAQAYPIVGFTWILVYQNQTDKTKGQELANVLWWAIHDGQQYANALNYPTLPASAVTKAENEILSMKYQGLPLLTK
jgi:phosphate transport system substrate-binding protein